MSGIIQGKEAYRQTFELENEISRYKNGVGSQANPGRSCKQIISNHVEQPAHVMFIDPNEGSAKDALAVTCQLHDNDRTSGKEFLISFRSVFE